MSKLNPNEIKKALECCMIRVPPFKCEECPLLRGTSNSCIYECKTLAYDRINQYEEEIENLHREVAEKTETIDFLKNQAIGWSIDFCNLKAKLGTMKSEAIKEFAERLKEYEIFLEDDDRYVGYAIRTEDIDNLVEEMEAKEE